MICIKGVIKRKMNINRTDLINQMHDVYGYTKKSATEFIDDLLELMLQNMEDGNTISLYGFGVFDIVRRNPKPVKHILSGEMIEVPEHWVPKFVPGRRMDIAVKKWQDNVKRGLI